MKSGVSQPNLAVMEKGKRRPSPEMLERILEAADYRPSVSAALHASEVIAAAQRYGLKRPKLFGSSVRGEDHYDSDIDVFVDAPIGAGLFPLAALARDIEEITGFPADVVAAGSAAKTERGRRLLTEAVPL